MQTALRIATILLVSGAWCGALGQTYSPHEDDSPVSPKKTLAIPQRRVKAQRLAASTPQTSIINQRFRRPIPINKPRPSSEPIPELPVFTSGIRGSRPSSAPLLSLQHEQNDEAGIGLQQQQPHIVYSQPGGQLEPKPVNEEQEKDEDVAQVIANLGNLLTSPSPVPPTAPSAIYQDRSQQIQPVQYKPAQQAGFIARSQVSSGADTPAIHQIIAPVQYRPAKPIRLPSKQQQQQQQQQQKQQQQQQKQQQQQQSQQQHQQKQQQQQQHHQAKQQQRHQDAQDQQQQHQTQQVHQNAQIHQNSQIRYQQILDRNEYDFNEPRPAVKQRPLQVAPKKSKPQDYYEGRTKKPVAQVIRRYREETADGSIIWGFENDDGSFKEEMIGIDCITRGKYGYVDPDGLRREYTYETGIKCDEEAQQQQDQDILNTFVDYQENKLVLPSGKTIDLSSMGKKQHRRPQPIYRN